MSNSLHVISYNIVVCFLGFVLKQELTYIGLSLPRGRISDLSHQTQLLWILLIFFLRGGGCIVFFCVYGLLFRQSHCVDREVLLVAVNRLP